MKHLTRENRKLFRKRGHCNEHGAPRPCYDCMVTAVINMEEQKRMADAFRKTLIRQVESMHREETDDLDKRTE